MARLFRLEFESGPVIQYNSVMRGYVCVPPDLLADTAEVVTWFDKSYDWIGTLPPKEPSGRSNSPRSPPPWDGEFHRRHSPAVEAEERLELGLGVAVSDPVVAIGG